MVNRMLYDISFIWGPISIQKLFVFDTVFEVGGRAARRWAWVEGRSFRAQVVDGVGAKGANGEATDDDQGDAEDQ